MGGAEKQARSHQTYPGLEGTAEEGLLPDPAGQGEKQALPKAERANQAPEGLGEKATCLGAAGELPGEEDDHGCAEEPCGEVRREVHPALLSSRRGIEQRLPLDPHPPDERYGKNPPVEKECHPDPARTREPLPVRWGERPSGQTLR